MRHKKEIIIKNPRLRALRNNLREILGLEWERRLLNVILAQSHLHNSDISREEKLLLHDSLELEYAQTKRLIKSSIIMCGWCHQRNKDAIYNPSNRQ